MHILSESGCQVFKIVAVFPIGRSLELKRALVQSTVGMIKKSTLSKSNKILHEYLDRYSIQLDIYSTPTHIQAQVHCQVGFIPQAISIFLEVLFQAQFEDKYWKIVRQQTMDSIAQQMNQTDFWADKLLSEHVFGEHHPYGYYSEPQDYMQITLNEIKKFYNEFIQYTKPNFFIAGDATSSAKKILLSELKKYSFRKIKHTAKPDITTARGGTIEKKIRGASQASIRLGCVLNRNSISDFQKLELISTFLGGYYSSELMKLLRINLGFTYGVYTYIQHLPEVSVLYISYETDKKNIEPSLNAISRLFKRLKKEKRIQIQEAAMEYYSQWSKNEELSLNAIMYAIRMHKLGYDYSEFLHWASHLDSVQNNFCISVESPIFDFDSYSKTIVY